MKRNTAMDIESNGSHGLAYDAGTFGDVVKRANEELIETLQALNKTLTELCDISQLDNREFLQQYPLHMTVNVDEAPRKLKKAYWKLFENRSVTWREKQRLKKWCQRGNMTLDKLSGKQVDAKPLESRDTHLTTEDA
jgi:hypothetical protein